MNRQTLTLTQLKAVKIAYAKHDFRSIKVRAKFALALKGVVEYHDIQSVRNKRTGNVVLYANRGDTYDPTVLCYVSYGYELTERGVARKPKAQFRLGSWGDLVESGIYE